MSDDVPSTSFLAKSMVGTRAVSRVMPIKRNEYKFDMLFISVLVDSWRKRRGEIETYTQQVRALQKAQINCIGQFHIYNMLATVEKNRNDSLEAEVEALDAEFSGVRNSCGELITVVTDLKDDLVELKEVTQNKYREFRLLSTLLVQANANLNATLKNKKELESKLARDREKVKALEAEEGMLLDELCFVKDYAHRMERDFKMIMEVKSQELQDALEALHLSQDEYEQMKTKEKELKEEAVSDFEITTKLNYMLKKVKYTEQPSLDIERLLPTEAPQDELESPLSKAVCTCAKYFKWFIGQVLPLVIISAQSTSFDPFDSDKVCRF